MLFNFVGLVDKVEGSLSLKVQNADPRVQPFYSQILLMWYVAHCNWKRWANDASLYILLLP